LEFDSRSVTALLNLGRLAVLEHDYTSAEKLVQQAISIEPNNLFGLDLLCAVGSATGQWQQVLTSAKRVHNLPHEGFAGVHISAAQALLQQNRTEEALGELGMFLKEHPDGAQADQVRISMERIQTDFQAGL
jgi:uncharacterized protein HemY